MALKSSGNSNKPSSIMLTGTVPVVAPVGMVTLKLPPLKSSKSGSKSFYWNLEYIPIKL